MTVNLKEKTVFSTFVLGLSLALLFGAQFDLFTSEGYSWIYVKVERSKGLAIDVYTQYATPYGGQGKNMASDAFALQDEVFLIANVTCNGEAVQDKLVNFGIYSPQGDYDAYRTAYTDATGIASISFTIPWPSLGEEEKVFGKWNVNCHLPLRGDVNNDKIVDIFDLALVAKAYGSQPGDLDWNPNADLNNDNLIDISDLVVVATSYGQVLVFDLLTFKVGWIVELLSLETCDEFGNLKSVFSKGELVYFNLTLRNISMRNKNATVAISTYDELGVPLGTTMHDVIVVPEEFVEVSVVGLEIPRWAYAGVGTAYANTYDAPPSEGGTVYCPEVSVTFTITS